MTPQQPIETQHRWQAEQAPYPSKVDYRGESSCIFELEAAAEQIVGEPASGDVFMYLFRRFGYPKFGWDDQKQLALYRITTPMEGVILMVEPGITGAYTFGYIMQEDIAEKYEAEDHKPFTKRYERFEPYAKPIPLTDQPDDSIMKQVHNALCDAIKDLLRPVHVRDVMINIQGKVLWSETLNQDKDSVEYAATAGCGVGNKLNKQEPV